jgi:hypothetical protein
MQTACARGGGAVFFEPMEEHHQTYQEKQWNGSPLLKAGFVMEKRAGDIPFRRQLLSVLSRPTRRSGVRVWHKVERKRYSDGRTALRDGWMLGVARARNWNRARALFDCTDAVYVSLV